MKICWLSSVRMAHWKLCKHWFFFYLKAIRLKCVKKKGVKKKVDGQSNRKKRKRANLHIASNLYVFKYPQLRVWPWLLIHLSCSETYHLWNISVILQLGRETCWGRFMCPCRGVRILWTSLCPGVQHCGWSSSAASLSHGQVCGQWLGGTAVPPGEGLRAAAGRSWWQTALSALEKRQERDCVLVGLSLSSSASQGCFWADLPPSGTTLWGLHLEVWSEL